MVGAPPEHDSQDPRVSAQVFVPRLSPHTLGRVKWWMRAARSAPALASRSARLPVDRRTALRSLRAGFIVDSGQPVEFLPLPTDHVSDRQRERAWSINWPNAGLLDDKLAFFFMLRQLGIPTPDVIGVIDRGRVHELGSERLDARGSWLAERLRRHGRLVVRPNRGGGGNDLFVLEARDEGYTLNGEPTGWAELMGRLGQLADHLVSAFVHQAAYARDIFSRTTNTVRIITMHPPGEEPFLAKAEHRFGTPRSVPTDNVGRGGVVAQIDTATGRLGPAIGASDTGETATYDHHPATGAPLTGAAVHNWELVAEGIVQAAAKLPFLPYIGWDVIVTDDGFVIVEGNKSPDRPGALLGDPRARAFYERFGVV